MTEEEINRRLAVFQKVCPDTNGWDTLYRDPTTGELWEVTYPHSEMHGGGPRHLVAISIAAAGAKYPALIS
jgi:hypothetical protein